MRETGLRVVSDTSLRPVVSRRNYGFKLVIDLNIAHLEAEVDAIIFIIILVSNLDVGNIILVTLVDDSRCSELLSHILKSNISSRKETGMLMV